MINLHRHPSRQRGQVIVIIALAMIGILAITALAVDGGMLYWNQRKAQNAADAAVIAGTSRLADMKPDQCSDAEAQLVALIEQYADNNEIPSAIMGGNVKAYYLTEDANGNRIDLINPSTGQPWMVGATGTIPCEATVGDPIVGLHVVTLIPQATFFANLIGIVETRVTAEAFAVWDNHNWCTDFAVFATGNDPSDKGSISLTGANITVTNGGFHSNGGMQIQGSGDGIFLDPDRSFEFNSDVTNSGLNINTDKINNGDPSALPDGLTDLPTSGAVPSYPLPDDSFYRFDDFKPGGYIWQEIVNTYGAGSAVYFPGDVTVNPSDLVDSSTGKLKNALFVTDGEFKLQNLAQVMPANGAPWRVTLVAKGAIDIAGGMNMLPLARNVLMYTTYAPGGNTDAIHVSGSDNKWAGLIYAPNGPVSFSAANNSNLTGMIVGKKVDFSGSNSFINHRPEYCPPNPPKITLIK